MANYHDYTIDWSPDQLTWSIDGNVMRTLKKADTWNATANRYSYPQSPSRVQLSLWPAGLPTNPEGTIDWAGGVIQWNSQYMTNGYYYAQVDSISIDCYDLPSDAQNKGSSSYVLTNKNANESDFAITNNPTVLGSFMATGLNMNLGASSSSSNSSSSVNTVPGLTGAGPGNDDHGGDTAAQSSGSSSAGQTASSGSSGSATTGFVQGGGSSGASSNIQSEKVLSGSLFAAIVAIVGLCIL